MSDLNHFNFVITESCEGERVDKCVNSLIDTLSRSYIQKLIAEDHLTVNGRAVRANYRVRTDDIIRVVLPDAVTPDILPEDIPLDILYEDTDVIVVNKPKGMVVHPAAGHYSGTLVNALLFHCNENLSGINGVLRPGIVHRIDKDTTGSVIACKNDRAHAGIAAQLKDHTILRKYHAIVHGVLKEEEGRLCTLIGRDPFDRKKMAVLPGAATTGPHMNMNSCPEEDADILSTASPARGKIAVTNYRVFARFKKFTYIECRLETGRTHQIRVHMAHLGHPLLGDTVYGPKSCPYPLSGQTLHAKILGFSHPVTGEYIETDAPLPAYFERLLEVL